MPDPYAYASFHVEDVAKDLPLLEGAEPEAEFPLQPEEVIEDQEQDLEQDLTDLFNTQGKHKCMIKPSTIYIWVLQLLLYLCIYVYRSWLIPSCMSRICLPKFLDIPDELVWIGTTALLSAIVPVVI